MGAYREIREIRRISQSEAAKALGVSGRTVYNWESGNCDPKATEIVGMARLYDVSADILLGITPMVVELRPADQPR